MKTFMYSLFFLIFAALFSVRFLKQEEQTIRHIAENDFVEGKESNRQIAQVKNAIPLYKKKMQLNIDEDFIPDERQKVEMVEDISELKKRYNLLSKTERFGDDEYYISKDISIVRADEYKIEMGQIISNYGDVLAVRASDEYFEKLAPVVVNKHTGRVEFPTGDVVVKTNEGETEDAIERAQKAGLYLKREHKEISTLFFTSKRPRDLFSQARKLQNANGVIYSRVEIIPGFQQIR